VFSAVVEELVRLLQLWQEDLSGHGGPECRSCPVCQLISVIRNTRPEVLEHLAAAVGEVAAAVRVVTPQAAEPSATTRSARAQPGGGGADGQRARGREPAPVEHIDVTD
jgi:putative component of membrane protein insertase Oxa1/YidC/SpoIIIJ protein YidD